MGSTTARGSCRCWRLSGYDNVAYLWLVGACSVVLYGPITLAVAAVQRPHFGWTELGFTAGSSALHLAHFLLLQRGYRSGDLSLVYPLPVAPDRCRPA